MRKFLLTSVLSLAAFLFLLPAQLRADGTDTFTFSETNPTFGSVTLTWQLLSTPTPDASAANQYFELLGVPALFTVTNAGTTTSGSVTGDLFFFNANNTVLPYFQFVDLVDSSVPFSLAGTAQMYSGLETSPTFIPGVYSGSDPTLSGYSTLTIVATPEPASILMLLVGFLALAGVVVLRKAQG